MSGLYVCMRIKKHVNISKSFTLLKEEEYFSRTALKTCDYKIKSITSYIPFKSKKSQSDYFNILNIQFNF